MTGAADITVPAAHRSFPCRAGDSALDALRPVHHRLINVGCHSGGCGVCKIRVLAGRYHTGLMNAARLTPEERARGITLACRTYPDGPLTIEILGKAPARACRRSGFHVQLRERRDP